MHPISISVFLLATIVQTCFCLQSIKYTFTDAQLYFDLSTYNFAAGSNEVYEYTLTARVGNKVSLYLFQDNTKQYTINAYDGENDQGIVLPIQNPTNKSFMSKPVPTISLSSKMFIRVTADNSDPNTNVDFQAAATDYAKPDGCGELVINVNVMDQNSNSVQFVSNAQRQCFYLLHANDPTNNPLLAQYVVSYPGDMDNFLLFKGLSMDGTHQLTKNDITTWASDKYIIIWPMKTTALDFAWTFIGNLNVNQAVAPYTVGEFMTNDYYQNNYPYQQPALAQSFILNLSPPMKQIQVSYLRLMGTGSLTVNAYSNGKAFSTEQYLPGVVLGPFNITYGCDKIELIYTTQNRNAVGGSGFYGLYQDVTIYPPTTTTVKPTSRPIQTTTKVARGFVYSFYSFILLSLLVLV